MRLRASVHRERWTPDQEHVADRPVTKHQHYHQAVYVMLNGGVLRGVTEGSPLWAPIPAERQCRTGYVLTMGPVTVPHLEEWVSGNPRAVWVELK